MTLCSLNQILFASSRFRIRRKMLSTLLLTALFSSLTAAQWPDPEPCSGTCKIHDSSILKHTDGRCFLFGSGDTLRTSKSLNGAMG